MSYIRQIINGQVIKSVNANGDVDAIKSLLEGKIEEYDEKASGGKAIEHPAKLNTVKFRLVENTNGLSTSMKIRHLDPAKTSNDISGAIVGKFDVDYDLTTKCDEAYLAGDSSNR